MQPSSAQTLWIVDDNASIRATLSMVLEFEGYRVEAFENGAEALDELVIRESASLPHLVLLDHQMPGLDGIQVLERIRLHPSLSGIKVVMLTGCAKVRGFPMADEALYKPIDADQLLASIRRHLHTPAAAALA